MFLQKKGASHTADPREAGGRLLLPHTRGLHGLLAAEPNGSLWLPCLWPHDGLLALVHRSVAADVRVDRRLASRSLRLPDGVDDRGQDGPVR